MQTLTLEIGGMHCAGCAQTLERVLGRSPGVRTVRVSYEAGTAQLIIDPARTSAEALTATIVRAGYRVAEGQHT